MQRETEKVRRQQKVRCGTLDTNLRVKSTYGTHSLHNNEKHQPNVIVSPMVKQDRSLFHIVVPSDKLSHALRPSDNLHTER
jgi:hypothetical protein